MRLRQKNTAYNESRVLIITDMFVYYRNSFTLCYFKLYLNYLKNSIFLSRMISDKNPTYFFKKKAGIGILWSFARSKV